MIGVWLKTCRLDTTVGGKARSALLSSLSMKKQDVLEVLEQLPDEFDAEQLMHHLYLQAKLEQAEAAVTRGEVVDHDQVVQRSQEWFK